MAYRNDLEALEARHAALAGEVSAKRRELADVDRLIEDAKARARLPVLDDIRVAAPCPVSWDSMKGDARVRDCSSCQKSVFNLSDLTRDEAEALIIEKAGSLCVTYFQRADGTIILADCEIGRDRKRRRRNLVAAGASALLAAAGGVLLGSSIYREPPAPAAVTAADDDLDARFERATEVRAAMLAQRQAAMAATRTTGAIHVSLDVTEDELVGANQSLALALQDAEEARAHARIDRDAARARAEAARVAVEGLTASTAEARRGLAEAERQLAVEQRRIEQLRKAAATPLIDELPGASEPR